MEEWSTVKEKIKFVTKNRNVKSNWVFRYKQILNNYHNMSIKEIKEYMNDNDYRVRAISKNRLALLKSHDIRKDFNNIVTIKLVIPGGCNADCEFCYNKRQQTLYNNSTLKDFKNNFIISLEKIVNELDGKLPFSLDITGNEPTFNPDVLNYVLNKIRSSYILKKFSRITLTTNGANLSLVTNNLKGVVDYVNISTHHFDFDKRIKIFRQGVYETDNSYSTKVVNLLNIGIDTSTVCVINKPINNPNKFFRDYIKWCKQIGFSSLRIRQNVFSDNYSYDFIKYMNDFRNENDITTITMENNPDSHWCRLSDGDGFLIYFLNECLDTSETSVGIEYIVHEDGLLYYDFNKTKKFNNNAMIPSNYIFDIKH